MTIFKKHAKSKSEERRQASMQKAEPKEEKAEAPDQPESKGHIFTVGEKVKGKDVDGVISKINDDLTASINRPDGTFAHNVPLSSLSPVLS